MKILEINKFNYLRRGAEKHFIDLIALLKSQGNEVAVFSMDHPKNIFSPWKKYFVSYAGFAKEDSLRAKIKGLFRIYSFEAKRKISKLLDDFKPDVVHLHNIYHHISPSILSEIKKRNIPVVMTVHDYNLICPDYSFVCNGKMWNELGPQREWYFIKNKCFKKSYFKSLLALAEFKFNDFFGFYDKCVDQLIVPSRFVKKIFKTEGIDPGKIAVMPHFVFQDPLACAWPKDKKIFQERYAFYYGSISKDKNVGALVKIFEKIPEVKLYLAGNMENGFILPKVSNIKYLGFLNPNEVEKYIKGSLFVVSASALPETFGLIALEAIKNGKPFIGLNSGAYREIIQSDKNGYLCRSLAEMEEKIRKISADEGLRILLSRNALERAKNFDSSKYYGEIMDIFRNCVKTQKGLDFSQISAKVTSQLNKAKQAF